MLANHTSSRWAEPGMKVIAPYDNRGTGLRCVVTVAAGYHARVTNEARGFDKWFYLGDLLVPITDPHA